MTPEAIFREARANGVTLALSPSGTIRVNGDSPTVNRWIELIKEHKIALVEILKREPALMTAGEETTIRNWLESIGETDPETIDEVLSACRRDAGARDYFLARSWKEGHDE